MEEPSLIILYYPRFLLQYHSMMSFLIHLMEQ